MTEQQKTLVRNSFEKIVPVADATGLTFYTRLFTIAPEVRPMFRGEIAQQSRKLMQVIAIAVKGLDHMSALVATVEELGRKHAQYGVKNEHYAVVGETLLWTLGETLGSDFDAETQAAWTAVYSLLSETMINAAPLSNAAAA